MKAILILDLDYDEQLEELNEAKEVRIYDSDGNYWEWEKFEIKPVPEIKDLRDYRDKIVGDYKLQIRISDFISGYNSCIDELLGEQK